MMRELIVDVWVVEGVGLDGNVDLRYALLYSAVLCWTMRYYAVLCSPVLCSAQLSSTLPSAPLDFPLLHRVPSPPCHHLPSCPPSSPKSQLLHIDLPCPAPPTPPVPSFLPSSPCMLHPRQPMFCTFPCIRLSSPAPAMPR